MPAKMTRRRSDDGEKPYIRRRLRRRLLDAGFPEPEQIATMVADWVLACGRQAQRDGDGVASDVFTKMAARLHRDLL